MQSEPLVSEGSEPRAEGAGDGAGVAGQRLGGTWHRLEVEGRSEQTGHPFRKPPSRKQPRASGWCDLRTGHRTPGAAHVPALSMDGKRWMQVLGDRGPSGPEPVSLRAEECDTQG